MTLGFFSAKRIPGESARKRRIFFIKESFPDQEEFVQLFRGGGDAVAKEFGREYSDLSHLKQESRGSVFVVALFDVFSVVSLVPVEAFL